MAGPVDFQSPQQQLPPRPLLDRVPPGTQPPQHRLPHLLATPRLLRHLQLLALPRWQPRNSNPIRTRIPVHRRFRRTRHRRRPTYRCHIRRIAPRCRILLDSLENWLPTHTPSTRYRPLVFHGPRTTQHCRSRNEAMKYSLIVFSFVKLSFVKLSLVECSFHVISFHVLSDQLHQTQKEIQERPKEIYGQ